MIEQILMRGPGPDWLTDGPISDVVVPYVAYFRERGYKTDTIRDFLSATAHFAHWLKSKRYGLDKISQKRINRFVECHLPSCACPQPCQRTPVIVRRALGYLSKVLESEGLLQTSSVDWPPYISSELDSYRKYLVGTCGLAPSTVACRLKYVSKFLFYCFGKQRVKFSLIAPAHVHDFIVSYAKRFTPSSLQVVRSSLRSYLRFRRLNGNRTEHLVAALPVIANWKRFGKVRQIPNEKQLSAFLNAFDKDYSTGLRDYAVARCLLDLGLRAHEVANLSLDSIDWRTGVITIAGGKGQRIQQLPLPSETGDAIAKYLVHGRHQSTSRSLFLRHKTPFNEQITTRAVYKLVGRAMDRAGLYQHFKGPHILRHAMASRLQESGASLKEIADLLRHKHLQNTAIYAKANQKELRAIALPWSGRQP
jgi:integrase/recombinase XerD